MEQNLIRFAFFRKIILETGWVITGWTVGGQSGQEDEKENKTILAIEAESLEEDQDSRVGEKGPNLQPF